MTCPTSLDPTRHAYVDPRNTPAVSVGNGSDVPVVGMKRLWNQFEPTVFLPGAAGALGIIAACKRTPVGCCSCRLKHPS